MKGSALADTTGEWKADATGTAAHARIRREAAAEQRNADRQEAREIAHHAVDDDARHAFGLGHQRRVVAEDGRMREAFAGRDQHVTLLRQRKRTENGEIVVGAGLASDRRADEGAAGHIERLDRRMQRTAPAPLGATMSAPSLVTP